jgi:hypothetical protein
MGRLSRPSPIPRLKSLAWLVGAAALAICPKEEARAQQVVDQPEARTTYTQAVEAIKTQNCQRATVLLKSYLRLAPATLALHPTLQDKINHQIELCSDKQCKDMGGHIVLRGEKSTCSVKITSGIDK